MTKLSLITNRSTTAPNPNPITSSAPLQPNNEIPDFPDLPGVPVDLPTHDSSPDGKGNNDVSKIRFMPFDILPLI